VNVEVGDADELCVPSSQALDYRSAVHIV
jgi:hypothetical protein